MNTKFILLGLSIVLGANFAVNSAYDECAWQCFADRVDCVEVRERSECDADYRACRAACNQN